MLSWHVVVESELKNLFLVFSLRPTLMVVLNAPFNMYFAPMVVLKSVE